MVDLRKLQAGYTSGIKDKIQPQKRERNEETREAKENTAVAETKQVEASALELSASQLMGIHFGKKVNTSDEATEKRIEKALKESSFMRKLNDLSGVEEEGFALIALAQATGCDPQKLAVYMGRPLSAEKELLAFADKLELI